MSITDTKQSLVIHVIDLLKFMNVGGGSVYLL